MKAAKPFVLVEKVWFVQSVFKTQKIEISLNKLEYMEKVYFFHMLKIHDSQNVALCIFILIVTIMAYSWG